MTALTRRGFLSGAAGAMAAGSANCGSYASHSATTAAQPARGDRILLKGGCVLSLDPQIGDFDRVRRDAEQSRDFIVGKAGWKKSRVVSP